MSDMRLIRLSKVARHFVVGIGIGACAQVFDSQPIGCSQIARLIKFQWGHSWAGVAVWILGRSIVLCISSWRLANGNANLSYRCILAGVDSHCLLSAFRQHHQCSNHPPPLFQHQANLSQLFECLFVNFLARKLCCKILCANIVFACFCCAKRQRPDAPLRSPPFPSRCREFLVLQRKLYQCASLFSRVSLPSFFLSFFLAVVCLLGLLFSFRAFVFDLRSAMYWYFQRLFVSFSLTLLLLLLYSVLFSWLTACCVQRATCSAAASFLCIRFYFITLFFGNFLKTQT